MDILSPLRQPENRRVGAKQVMRAISEGRATRVFIARDAEPGIVQPVVLATEAQGVEIIWVDSMRKLGDACAIDVAASVAALLI